MKLLGERIIIERIAKDEDEKTDSGLYLAPGSKNPKDSYYKTAKVIESGCDVKNVEKGDTIVFDKRGAVDIVIEDKEYSIFNVSSVVAVL